MMLSALQCCHMSIPASQITDVLLLRHQAINIYSLVLFIVPPKIDIKILLLLWTTHRSEIIFWRKKMTQLFLTHWGSMTHICISHICIIGSNNGLSLGWCQAIIWTNAGILSIGPLRATLSENFIKIHTFSFMKMHLKISSGKWRPFCLSLNALWVNLAMLPQSSPGWHQALQLPPAQLNPQIHHWGFTVQAVTKW